MLYFRFSTNLMKIVPSAILLTLALIFQDLIDNNFLPFLLLFILAYQSLHYLFILLAFPSCSLLSWLYATLTLLIIVSTNSINLQFKDLSIPCSNANLIFLDQFFYLLKNGNPCLFLTLLKCQCGMLLFRNGLHLYQLFLTPRQYCLLSFHFFKFCCILDTVQIFVNKNQTSA